MAETVQVGADYVHLKFWFNMETELTVGRITSTLWPNTTTLIFDKVVTNGELYWIDVASDNGFSPGYTITPFNTRGEGENLYFFIQGPG